MKKYNVNFKSDNNIESITIQANTIKEARKYAQFYKRKNITFKCKTVVKFIKMW